MRCWHFFLKYRNGAASLIFWYFVKELYFVEPGIIKFLKYLTLFCQDSILIILKVQTMFETILWYNLYNPQQFHHSYIYKTFVFFLDKSLSNQVHISFLILYDANQSKKYFFNENIFCFLSLYTCIRTYINLTVSYLFSSFFVYVFWPFT